MGILLEQSGDHGRVEVGTNTYDHSVLEIYCPAAGIVEAHAIFGRCLRMQLDHCLTALNDYMIAPYAARRPAEAPWPAWRMFRR
jgi:hypothetical protein